MFPTVLIPTSRHHGVLFASPTAQDAGQSFITADHLKQFLQAVQVILLEPMAAVITPMHSQVDELDSRDAFPFRLS